MRDLGLHITARLVTELEGAIDVRTAAGRGTAFSVFLPNLGGLIVQAARVADHVARDERLLNLARAFIDAEQSHVAIEALDSILFHVAGAAEDLHRAIGDAAHHFAGEQLCSRTRAS